MNMPAEIAPLLLDDAQSAWLDTLQQRAAESARQLAEKTTELDEKTAALDAANLKIHALMLELARYRRITFSSTSEAMKAQRSLFEETQQSDIAAIQEELTHTADTLSSGHPSITASDPTSKKVPIQAAKPYRTICPV